MGYSLRTEQYRYTEWPAWQINEGPQWDSLAGVELYDHSVDPKEDINLAERPQFIDLRKRLSDKLRSRVAGF